MKNTELFKLLKNFSPTDFVAFEKFLASPFHIKNKPLKVIFQILKDKNNLIIDSDYTKLRRIVKRKTAFPDATITKFTGNCLFRYGSNCLYLYALDMSKNKTPAENSSAGVCCKIY